MKKKKLSFVFLLILLFEITISAESKNATLLKYVLEWPPTFCLQLTEEEGRCKEPIPQDLFTLHGLMPADAEGFNIEYCPYNGTINWDKLFEPIRDELITFWPSLRENYNETEFWKHEWEAHGSCGGTTPEEYFYKAIAINFLPERGNLFNYLLRKGLLPSDHAAYPKHFIVEAIQSVFDEFPSLLRQRRPPPPRPVARPPPPRPRPPPPSVRPPPPRPPPPSPRPPPPRPPPPSPRPPPPRPPPPSPRPPPPRPPPPRPPPPSPRPPPPRPPPPSPRPPPPRPPPPSPRPPPPSPPPPSPRPPPPSPPPPSPPPPSPSPPPPPPPSPPPPSPHPPPPPLPPHNIYLSCIPYNPELNIYLLYEVTLCTNLEGTEYIACPLEADPASCPDDARIRLPLPNNHIESYISAG